MESDADRLERSYKAMLEYTSKIKVISDIPIKHFQDNPDDIEDEYLNENIKMPDENERNKDFFEMVGEVFSEEFEKYGSVSRAAKGAGCKPVDRKVFEGSSPSTPTIT